MVSNLQKQAATPASASPRHVCMVTFSFYENDNRVLRYAEALAERGDEVEVLALRRAPELPREETLRRVRVIRLRDRFDNSGRSKLGHLIHKPIPVFWRSKKPKYYIK